MEKRPPAGTGVRLSKCTRDYAIALTDPRRLLGNSQLPCVPDLVNFPTYKFSVRGRGTCLPDTAGSFSIACAPSRPYGGLDGALYVTGPGSAWSLAQPPQDIGAGSWVGFTSPLSAADFTGGTAANQVRVVGAAIYVRSLINPLNRKGIIRAWRSPTANSTTVPASTIASMSETVNFSNDGKEIVATYKPRSSEDLGFHQNSDPGFEMSQFKFGIFGSGLDAADVLEVEYVAFYEALGPALAHGVSKSHADPVGFGAVLQTNTHAGHKADAAPTMQVLRQVGEAVLSSATSLITHPAARAAAQIGYAAYRHGMSSGGEAGGGGALQIADYAHNEL